MQKCRKQVASAPKQLPTLPNRMASICGGEFRRSHKADKVFDVKYKLISQWDLLNLSPQIEAILLGNMANRPFALISSKMPSPICRRSDGEPWVAPHSRWSLHIRILILQDFYPGIYGYSIQFNYSFWKKLLHFQDPE